MQSLTEKVFTLAPPGGLFDETVVVNLYPNLSDGARKALVFRAVSRGEVMRLKPGLFCLAETYRKTHPHPFVVAGVLHFPSHVSLQTALFHHGLIPELVYQVTSVTSQRKRTFRSGLGTFTYQRVPCSVPRVGVRSVNLGRDSWAFVATPLRAIADLVYLNREISWETDGLRFLTDSMRMDDEVLEELPIEDSSEVLEGLRNKRTRLYIAGLQKELRR